MQGFYAVWSELPDGRFVLEQRCRIECMERNLEQIVSEVLQMSVEARAALAKRLLDSLEHLTPEENERLWIEEAARRHQQLRNGTARSVPSEELFARLDARDRK